MQAGRNGAESSILEAIDGWVLIWLGGIIFTLCGVFEGRISY
jgi:hypothetical protein